MKSVKSTPIEAGISTVLAGELLQLGPERVRQLIKDGYVVRSAHGRVTIRQAVQGYLRFRDDSERRSSKSASASRVQDARAREIDVRTAERDGRLVDLTEHLDVFAEVIGALKAELMGVPAQASAAMDVRRKIERAINDALGRCAIRFEKASAEAVAETRRRAR